MEEGVKKRHYTMQMIWLLGAVAPAKKVHFNLNGSELRGFPIKARSGQSSILYANPLAPKAVARFCLCLAVITGANVPVVPVCQNFLTHIYSCHTYSRLTHTYSQSHTHTGHSFHLISSDPWMCHSTFQKVSWLANGAQIDRRLC